MALDYKALLDLKADDDAPLRFLGEAAYLYFYRGASDEALALFEALTVIVPDDPVGWLGQCEVALASGDARSAVQHAQKATRTANVDAPAMAFAYLLQGRAHLKAGQQAEAEKVLAQAAEVDPESDVGRTATELIQALHAVNDGDGSAS